MYLITLLKSGVRLLVEILTTACKLMSVKEHLYLLMLIFKQGKLFGRAREGNLGSRRIFLTVLAGHKKILAGRYLPTPVLDEIWVCRAVTKSYLWRILMPVFLRKIVI
jgi:hypothetical protein